MYRVIQGILLNIMFHAPMGIFQLEFILFYYLFFHQHSVDNVALTTNGPQERKTQLLKGTTNEK